MSNHLFKKGQPPGPGRPKDSISKRSLRFADALMDAGVDPVKELIGALNNARLCYETSGDLSQKAIFNSQIIQTAEKMLPYMYPKLATIEVTKENPFEAMTAQEKIETMKQAIQLLERDVHETTQEPTSET